MLWNNSISAQWLWLLNCFQPTFNRTATTDVICMLFAETLANDWLSIRNGMEITVGKNSLLHVYRYIFQWKISTSREEIIFIHTPFHGKRREQFSENFLPKNFSGFPSFPKAESKHLTAFVASGRKPKVND